MRKILSFVLVCGTILLIVTGCSLRDKSGGNNAGSDELAPVSSVAMGDEEANTLKDKTPIQLYFISEQGNKLSSETRYISNSEIAKGSAGVATAALKELIKGPAKGSLLQATIPQGTTVHSDVTIKDGIATVDLSKEFISKHAGGKKNEQMTLYSIVNTLTEIKDIKSVKFKVDGKVHKDFKGNYEIDIAYPRSAFLITSKPEETENAKSDQIKGNPSQPSIEKKTEPDKNYKGNPSQPSIEKKAEPDKNYNGNPAQPSVEKKTEPAKNDNDSEKNNNSDSKNDSNDVKTNVDLLE
jgi:hypothetical protein